MNKTITITLLALLLSLLGCYQESIEQEIDIYYEFFDNVSPVIVKLSVNEDIYYATWTVNDSTDHIVGGKNEIELYFTEAGVSNIKLNASGTNNKKYHGEIDVLIPERADQLKINGVYFDEVNPDNFTSDSLNIRFNYYNGERYFSHKKTLHRSELANTDSLFFNQPIRINISGLEQGSYADSTWIYFIIESQNEYPISTYFRSNFSIKPQYFIERMLSPNHIQLFCNAKDLFILSDWVISKKSK